jgi:glutathione S-transferase
MSYRLYGELGSGAGIVELALASVGVDYELHEVSLGRGQQRSEEYARLNPQRKLPTLLTPSGEILTESAAIVIVLDERHPAAALLPPIATPERAQALRWLLFLASELYPIVEINDYPERFAPEGVPSDAVRERARGIWRERWLTLEHQIQGDPWLLRSGFCFTDVYLAALSRWAQQGDFRRSQTPRVERIAEAVAARPVLAPIWRRHYVNEG